MMGECTVGGTGQRSILLVIGRDVGFSDLLMTYACDLSQRMKYAIRAINLSDHSAVHTRFSRKTITIAASDVIETIRAEGVEQFRALADERRIHFSAESRAGDLDSVVRLICAECEDIDLIIAEPEFFGITNENAHSAPAFSLAPEGNL
jgi:hypothetical protein